MYKLIIMTFIVLFLTSCLHVTVNRQPTNDWLWEWERCYHDSQCNVGKMTPWWITEDA